MASTTHYDRLREYIFDLEIIDTHEHLAGEESNSAVGDDLLAEYLMHYFMTDMISAGMPAALQTFARDASKPLEKRWDAIEPYWEAARNTGYGRCMDITARGLYGFDRIDRRTIVPLNEAFLAARAAGGAYENVLKRKSRIRLAVLHNHHAAPAAKVDQRYFRAIFDVDPFIMYLGPARLRTLAGWAEMGAIRCLNDLEAACEKAMDVALAAGAVGLKSWAAYYRPLRYQNVPRSEAEAAFKAVAGAPDPAPGSVCPPMAARLQDYMMHLICRLADRRGLVFQLHTGIQAGNAGIVYHADPALALNLFMAYPNARFDILHAAYPYQQVLSALAKNLPNVFIDFAWTHILSPEAATRALVEFLDAVPANKILGFGGDFCFLDPIYGHQYIARENIARALSVKIDCGCFDLERAKRVARMILVDNPVFLFRL
jgi:hypothetical protein